jgi:hypothetical protein
MIRWFSWLLNYDCLDCLSISVVFECMKLEKLILILSEMDCLDVAINSHIRQVVFATLTPVNLIDVIQSDFRFDSVSFFESSNKKLSDFDWICWLRIFANPFPSSGHLWLRIFMIFRVFYLFNNFVELGHRWYLIIRGLLTRRLWRKFGAWWILFA